MSPKNIHDPEWTGPLTNLTVILDGCCEGDNPPPESAYIQPNNILRTCRGYYYLVLSTKMVVPRASIKYKQRVRCYRISANAEILKSSGVQIIQVEPMQTTLKRAI